MVKHTAHNGKAVGSNPTAPNKVSIKRLKTALSVIFLCYYKLHKKSELGFQLSD